MKNIKSNNRNISREYWKSYQFYMKIRKRLRFSGKKAIFWKNPTFSNNMSRGKSSR